LPEKKYLYSKNISDYSIGAYKELYGGISVLFEAIPVIIIRTGTGLENIIQEVFVLVKIYKYLEF
jgi:hypothetical protein